MSTLCLLNAPAGAAVFHPAGCGLLWEQSLPRPVTSNGWEDEDGRARHQSRPRPVPRPHSVYCILGDKWQHTLLLRMLRHWVLSPLPPHTSANLCSHSHSRPPKCTPGSCKRVPASELHGREQYTETECLWGVVLSSKQSFLLKTKPSSSEVWVWRSS